MIDRLMLLDISIHEMYERAGIANSKSKLEGIYIQAVNLKKKLTWKVSNGIICAYTGIDVNVTKQETKHPCKLYFQIRPTIVELKTDKGEDKLFTVYKFCYDEDFCYTLDFAIDYANRKYKELKDAIHKETLVLIELAKNEEQEAKKPKPYVYIGYDRMESRQCPHCKKAIKFLKCIFPAIEVSFLNTDLEYVDRYYDDPLENKPGAHRWLCPECTTVITEDQERAEAFLKLPEYVEEEKTLEEKKEDEIISTPEVKQPEVKVERDITYEELKGLYNDLTVELKVASMINKYYEEKISNERESTNKLVAMLKEYVTTTVAQNKKDIDLIMSKVGVSK